MARYERSVFVDAPPERVWDFHSRPEGLVELTPEWLRLRVESVRGPDGQPEPDRLDAGSRITSSIRPFGIGPRQRWTSEIVARREGEDAVVFRDVMHDGPFPHWEHTHRFVAHGDGTEIFDLVEYELPGGPIGRALGPVGVVGFEPMFAHRHRRARELLEDG